MDTKTYFEQLSAEALEQQLDKWAQYHQVLTGMRTSARIICRRLERAGVTDNPGISALESHIAAAQMEVKFILTDILGTEIRRDVEAKFGNEEPEDQTYEE